MRKLLLVVLTGLATPALAEDFNLICSGNGVADDTDTITTNVDKSDGTSATATTTVDVKRPFSGDATVEITADAGRIRLPTGLVPAITGGKNGWFELRNLNIGQNDITAKAAVSFISKPNVRIDRIAGTLSIDGNIGSFNGACRAYDPSKPQRAF